MARTLSFTRRRLPHWLVADASYFVTLRLHGTLPGRVLAELREERERTRSAMDDCDGAEYRALLRTQFRRLDQVLDAGSHGHAWLGVPRVATLVFGNLDWLETSRGWWVQAASLMPNHAHLVLRSRSGRDGAIRKDLKEWKRHAAREANRILGRNGRFWAEEGFDHWCRTAQEAERAATYTIMNPVRAGLATRWQDWPWTRADPEAFATGTLPE